MLIEIVKFAACLAGTIVITPYIVHAIHARSQHQQSIAEEQLLEDLFYCGCEDSLLAHADDLLKARER